MGSGGGGGRMGQDMRTRRTNRATDPTGRKKENRWRRPTPGTSRIVRRGGPSALHIGNSPTSLLVAHQDKSSRGANDAANAALPPPGDLPSSPHLPIRSSNKHTNPAKLSKL